MKISFLSEPILRRKQKTLDLQDLRGSWQINWKIRNITLFSAIYTRIDQVFVIWGLISVIVFSVAQLLPFSWRDQAIAWSILTLVGVLSMITLTTFWAQVERLMWLVYFWVALMLVGMFVTDLGIYLNWGIVLLNLCPIWLGLSAIGYLGTGWGIQSRTFIILGIIHLLSIGYVQYVTLPFLATGVIMGGSLLLLAQVQWDMRPPIDYSLLTQEEKAFNHNQHLLRQQF
ncbi:hypothetical protein C7H19_04870 [Aphanothece hegewaldii CCALA 016]|uniref:Uncharacterized protein n=1 Tax=Aphanothece hegewaldii CCALA 016 TaxID=2107694 RepID=A0A2T1M0W2_9CHRO|nr:hypothetical protein C7H19_04870 [Aphanothece hegewaldii CCALA 016]